jgi:hypothetical protein
MNRPSIILLLFLAAILEAGLSVHTASRSRQLPAAESVSVTSR